MNKYKECILCKQPKNIDDFYKLSNGEPRSYCKSCDIKKAADWNKNNPSKNKEIRRNYYYRNRQAILKQQSGYYLNNKEHIVERERNRRHKNPRAHARMKREQAWKRFGASYNLFDKLLILQDNKCAICTTVFDEKHKPQFDHDHITIKPRGLLCIRCNTNLPYIEDKEFVKRANLYLKKHSEA